MATILDYLKAEGAQVIEVGDWRNHQRPGFFDPVGVMMHHTAGTNSLNIIVNGRTGLPGPLSQILINKAGQVYLVSDGRCNHAGLGNKTVLDNVKADIAPDRDATTWGLTVGNGWFYGIEIENLGTGNDPYPAVQVAAAVKTVAAYCRMNGWSSQRVISHREWTSRKNDPSGDPLHWPGAGTVDGWPGMHEFRTMVTTQLEGGFNMAWWESPTGGALTQADADLYPERVEKIKRLVLDADPELLETASGAPVAGWTSWDQELVDALNTLAIGAAGKAVFVGEGHRLEVAAAKGLIARNAVPGPKGDKGDKGAKGATGDPGTDGPTVDEVLTAVGTKLIE